MEYINCPLCGKKTSINTINRGGNCNECNSRIRIKNILNTINLNEMYSEVWKNQYLGEFVKFVKLSKYSYVWKVRAINDFRNILKSFDQKVISEKELEKIYFQISPYKSSITLETIKIYLFSKQKINFDKPLFQWINSPLKNSYYYQPTILEYFFDESKCSDCGVIKTSKGHNFCNNCINRRSLVNFCKKVELKETFTNDEVRNYFKRFLNFLLDSKLSYRHICNISIIAIIIFQYLDSDVNNSSSKSITTLDGNVFQEIITPRWISSTFSKLPISKFSQKDKTNISPTLGHLVSFLEKEKIIIKDSFNPEIILDEENITVNTSFVSTYQTITEKIKVVPAGFRNLLKKYLEIEKKRNEVLERKHASKNLSWRSIDGEFIVIFSLIKWLINNESIDNWSVVTQDIINRYLLTFEKLQNRDLQKRKLYNFFEFGKKNNFLLQNPIPPFKSRSYSFIERVLTRKDHKELYESIKQGSKYNPTDALLTALCYFHALTSKQISALKLSDVDMARKCIHIEGRAPAYLSELEIQNLNNHLSLVDYDRNHYEISFLFFSTIKGRAHQISTQWLNRRVKSIYDITPSMLRRAGLQYCAEMFGPQYLHDCFGLSLTHTARFGDPNDRIIEDIIKDELTDHL